MHTEAGRVDHSAAHRSTQSELLVARLHERSESTWAVDLSLPRSHWLCHPIPGTVPLTLIVEALRQAGMAVCIAGFQMDPTVHFIISSLSVRTDRRQLAFPRFGAFDCTTTVEFTEIVTRKGRPFRLEVDYAIGTAVTAHISAQVLSDAEYRVVRRHARPLGETIVEAAHTTLVDPVRTEGSATAVLGVNEADPFFFDHAVDHLPGMLLLHASAALHEFATGSPAEALEVSFPSFAELRLVTGLHAEVADHGRTSTTVTQGERIVASVIAHSARQLVGGSVRV